MAKIPDQIDKYKIEGLVASGGMGAVYKGVHPTLDRFVILKKLTLRGNSTITERFKREARILMDFRNDYIVDVYDHFVKGRTHYIVMEHVDGLSVKDLLDRERYLDNASAAYITLYTAKALKYAHEKSVIHRDIKPGNVLISKDGDVKLADFGIASSADREAEESDLTTDGMTLGTPAYMAPEQFENSRTVDYRADLYSLGVMLYEMLVGAKPYTGGFTPEVIKTIQKGKYKRPRRVNPAISRELQRIIVATIKPRLKTRLSDLNKLIRRLEYYLKKFNKESVKKRIIALTLDEALPALIRRRRKNPVLFWSGLLLSSLLILVVSLGMFLTNIHLFLFLPADYGLLRLEVEKSMSQPSTEIFIDDNAEIPSLGRNIHYLPWGSGYKSLPIAIPLGQYRTKNYIDGTVVWNSFLLAFDGNKPSMQNINIQPEAASSVLIRSNIRDGVKGLDLNGIARVAVQRDSEYQIISPEQRLANGNIYKFRVSAENYLNQYFSLNIAEDTEVLNFNINLLPIPTAIQFITLQPNDSIQVRINQQSDVRTLNGGIYNSEATAISTEGLYELLPDNYQIYVRGQNWESRMEIDALSGETYTIYIDTDQGRIELK